MKNKPNTTATPMKAPKASKPYQKTNPKRHSSQMTIISSTRSKSKIESPKIKKN